MQEPLPRRGRESLGDQGQLIWLFCVRPLRAAFGAATAIMMIAALGFVSVGMRPPTPELGLMMVELLALSSRGAHALLTPVIVTFLILLGLNLIAGGRRA